MVWGHVFFSLPPVGSTLVTNFRNNYNVHSTGMYDFFLYSILMQISESEFGPFLDIQMSYKISLTPPLVLYRPQNTHLKIEKINKWKSCNETKVDSIYLNRFFFTQHPTSYHDFHVLHFIFTWHFSVFTLCFEKKQKRLKILLEESLQVAYKLYWCFDLDSPLFIFWLSDCWSWTFNQIRWILNEMKNFPILVFFFHI